MRRFHDFASVPKHPTKYRNIGSRRYSTKSSAGNLSRLDSFDDNSHRQDDSSSAFTFSKGAIFFLVVS